MWPLSWYRVILRHFPQAVVKGHLSDQYDDVTLPQPLQDRHEESRKVD